MNSAKVTDVAGNSRQFLRAEIFIAETAADSIVGVVIVKRECRIEWKIHLSCLDG
ncbi:uncharacterized protein PHALS_11672 [Plasmopara halstedii]|uniref:Uncharacterized protein n=1 Tax=Plasmopara halstedii TaxID=4781 RepID=A0A0P1AK80_PLAHL|nr:uncharacterized protein PHALS_11672 [Plasmopara halstedii]CEG41319.1 hypothetical protein PHALS_11672 [Plasmopara halstedii]|eukprot:XP_024577688.1 hypothetical protein PHALS_11672 [Plasmopara halstedii]